MSESDGAGSMTSCGPFDWLGPLLQTGDSLFPSGSYAHSFGLEGLVQLGLVTDRNSLADFLFQQVIPALGQLELPQVRFADEAALDGNVARLLELDERCAAMKGTLELRQASSRMGAQRLLMLRALTPHPLLDAIESERTGGRFQAHAPIVFGVQIALGGVPLEAGLLSYYYQTLAAWVSAAMKLTRLGQTGAQSLLGECLGSAPAVVRRAVEMDEEEIGCFQPLLEIASAQHERAYTRIFIS